VVSRKLFRARIRGQVVLYALLHSSVFFLSFVVLDTKITESFTLWFARGTIFP
jgi:hypothetical protein